MLYYLLIVYLLIWRENPDSLSVSQICDLMSFRTEHSCSSLSYERE